ncbi:MAG: WbqC family protein [Bacteroidales bacterium]|nr:WbqC family protein [Bacteroidales bacterium]
MKAVLFSSYFPPIQYISKFFLYNNIYIDIFENYQRQTYRNRCEILTANGKANLSVPIIKSYRQYFKDTQIDYSLNWQKNHYMALVSAYKNSAFFDFYIDSFNFIFKNKEKFLFDLNHKILENCFKILGVKPKFEYSKSFINQEDTLNLRELISPKSKIIDKDFELSEYYQVFKERHGFIPNLSIIDLLFNQGPQSIIIIKNSVKLS